MRKYPINRNYDAIYTIKIPNLVNFIGEDKTSEITKLKLKLPDEIEEAEDGLECFVLHQKFKENYLRLMLEENDNSVFCELNNGVISISDVDEMLEELGADDFLRVAFFRLKNPDLSSTNS